ncbi:unnamed protein product [Porites evermanni]|uniref:Uncharacterized protein n=1 Tax=Porites evermanni TaxID=104178 RepID=A0ABN8MIV0_9CNID|nr:unnamed protein product [Porites evermanni]
MMAIFVGCSYFRIVVLLLFNTVCGQCLRKQNSSSTSVLAKLFSDYDQVVRPGFEGQAVEIVTDLYVESFGNIHEANMEFKVYGYLRQRWKDERLAGKLEKTLTIKGENINRVWLPDPFCYNARDSNLMLPDSAVHSKVSIAPDGNILYTRGVTFLASCGMELHHFPFDSQECFLKIGSYAYTIEDIIYKWKYNNIEVGATRTAQFDVYKGSLSSSVDIYKTVTYFLKRHIGYYLIQVYFTDIFVVALSWIVFWMDKNDMGNRMAIGITTILTITFLLGSLNGFMPRVSYPKALDWYLLVSFTLTFLSLVECMIVFVVFMSENKAHDDQKGQGRADSSSATVKAMFHDDQAEVLIERSESKPRHGVNCVNQGCQSNTEGGTCEKTAFLVPNQQQQKSKRGRADFIDKISRGLFPLIFFTFNIAYWCFYLLIV